MTTMTPSDAAVRVEQYLGHLQARREAGHPLSPEEAGYLDTLTAAARAEAEARDAFSVFYAALSTSEGGGAAGADAAQVSLPVEVAAKVNTWIEQRKAWDALFETLLASPSLLPPAVADTPASRLPTPRTGARLRATPPSLLRVPTALPAKDTLLALFAPHLWRTDAGGTAITARVRDETQVRVECDEVMGFGPERAIQQIARHGASLAQTFLTMAGLWLQQIGGTGASHETYLSVYASDLLRFQRRKQTPRGGYHQSDLLAKGRDVYLLSRISVPHSAVIAYEDGARVTKTLTIGRLLSVESLDAEQTMTQNENGEMLHSLVRFRYHLGRDVYDWVCGDHPQYAALSSKLLAYHPIRQKYQILLGFCLAYYDRVNRKNRQETRSLSLPALLNLAALVVPQKRIGEFLQTIEDALNDLGRDGVVPGIRLRKPDDWPALLAARKTRAIIAGSTVEFPRLLGQGGGAAALPETPSGAVPSSGVRNPALRRPLSAGDAPQ